jgi:hypothetical protein
MMIITIPVASRIASIVLKMWCEGKRKYGWHSCSKNSMTDFEPAASHAISMAVVRRVSRGL